MPEKNRKTLKAYFQNNRRPDELQFSDLIDSMVSRVDDGITSGPDDALSVWANEEGGDLISMFSYRGAPVPAWQIRALPGEETGGLVLGRPDESDFLITKQGQVGLGTDMPEAKLDVRGTVRMAGRVGTLAAGEVPADGNWYAMLENLDGHQALEVVASAALHATGRHALTHATCLRTYGGWRTRSRITQTNAWYLRRSNRIQLRWTGDTNASSLEIRVRRNYGEGALIKYFISSLLPPDLWADAVEGTTEEDAVDTAVADGIGGLGL